jgi:shikimate kinase
VTVVRTGGGTVKTRAPNIRELKAQRVIYLTAQIELLAKQSKQALLAMLPLAEEKDRLVEHLGYDPSQGKVES